MRNLDHKLNNPLTAKEIREILTPAHGLIRASLVPVRIGYTEVREKMPTGYTRITQIPQYVYRSSNGQRIGWREMSQLLRNGYVMSKIDDRAGDVCYIATHKADNL